MYLNYKIDEWGMPNPASEGPDFSFLQISIGKKCGKRSVWIIRKFMTLTKMYTNPRTLEKTFEFYDWKKFFADYFLPCNGIQAWRIIKIKKDGRNIMVANSIGDELQ